VDGKLVAADARSVAMGTTTLQGHTAFEEYRYDALGRRIWVRARRWCDDTQGAGCGADAVSCQVSSVRRTVWDGNQELAEIEMPATDSTASTTIENDTLAIVRSVPGTGDALYDANRLYGQVLYVNGMETDRPLAITRNRYADASSTTGSATYAVYAPFSIVPLWNSQGRADRAVIGGTAAPGQDYLCADTGKTRCANVYLDQGVFPYARSGAAMGSWNGTVLIDKADATGTYYRRNRSYDPATARFTQEDPIGLAGGLNAYGFASGDPVSYSDPFGLCPPKTLAEVPMCTGQLLQPAQGPLEIAGTLVTAPLAGGGAVEEIGTEVLALGRTLEAGGGGILAAGAVAQRVAGATGGTVSRLSQSPGFKVTVSGARDIVARIKATGEMRVGIDGIGALTREGLISSNRALTHLKDLSSADLTDLVNIAKQFLNVPR
jgi:RHS repeat-associated protein